MLTAGPLPLLCAALLAPAGDPPTPADDTNRETHAVGIYAGYIKTGGKLHGGRAKVRVERPGKAVTLVLVAYDPVTWEVAAGKDTRVEKVVLGGYSRAAVTGLPDGTPVVEGFRGGKDGSLPYHPLGTDDPTFRALAVWADRATGRALTSFTGPQAEADRPLVVDRVQADGRLSTDYPVPVAAKELPDLTFTAHAYVPGRHARESFASVGTFTLTGPKEDTLRPLPGRVVRTARDPAGGKYYGLSHHEVFELDADLKAPRELDLGLDVPKLNWPADVTFDTKRGRLLLVSSEYLYAYDPKAGTWSALAERPPTVIAYHPKDDVVYGLGGDDGRGEGRELLRLNAAGAVVGRVKLDGPFLPGMLALRRGEAGVQLVPAGDKLVLLVGPAGRHGGEGLALEGTYLYLLDPKTGKAKLAWKGK